MPVASDLPACPFLTVSEPHEGAPQSDEEDDTSDEEDDSESGPCSDTDNYGKTGWLNPFEDGGGCGMFYDCCARIIPVACMGEGCMFFSPPSSCALGAASGADPILEAIYVQEWLFRRDLTGDGKIYGHTWTMGDPPPALRNIPDDE